MNGQNRQRNGDQGRIQGDPVQSKETGEATNEKGPKEAGYCKSCPWHVGRTRGKAPSHQVGRDRKGWMGAQSRARKFKKTEKQRGQKSKRGKEEQPQVRRTGCRHQGSENLSKKGYR